MSKILLSFGTRPELIKIAPVIREFKGRSARNKLILVHTGQHDELTRQDIQAFRIQPDYYLELARKGKNLSNLLGSLLIKFDELVDKLLQEEVKIGCIVAQGDTASTYCSALQAFHCGIPFYHIEAGMRTYDLGHPFPEEFYRSSISSIAEFHFTPTETEYHNLVNEGISADKILITGNTVIDNLRHYLDDKSIQRKNKALITLHRRETSELIKLEYINYFKELAIKNQDWKFVWITHPGTKLDQESFELIENFRFTAPVPYFDMLHLFSEVSCIFTDSGGIQEEAGYLGIPCILVRKKTERVQSLSSGISKILDLTELDMSKQLEKFDSKKLWFKNNLYGDGKSGEAIVNKILERIN